MSQLHGGGPVASSCRRCDDHASVVASVRSCNLGTVIHEFKGYAQRDSGGTYMASPPLIAAELKWAGFDMLGQLRSRKVFEGFVAVLSIAGKRHKRVRLLPVDLQSDGTDDRRGRPQFASPEVVRRIVETVAALRHRHPYEERENCGVIAVA